MDSLRDEVAQYYSRKGTIIKSDGDQDSHDMEKCLKYLDSKQRNGILWI
jgi:thiamine pyrophosphokinase